MPVWAIPKNADELRKIVSYKKPERVMERALDDAPPTKRLNNDSVYVMVKTLAGKTYNTTIFMSWKGQDLYKHVSSLTGVPPDQLRLIFGGKIIDYNTSLHHYSFSDHCTIYVLLRLRGGMYRASSGRHGTEEGFSVNIFMDDQMITSIIFYYNTPLSEILKMILTVFLQEKGYDPGDLAGWGVTIDHLPIEISDTAAATAKSIGLKPRSNLHILRPIEV